MQESPLFSLHRNKYGLTSAKPTARSRWRRLSRMTCSLLSLFLYFTKQREVKRDERDAEDRDVGWHPSDAVKPNLNFQHCRFFDISRPENSAVRMWWIITLQLSPYDTLLKIRFGSPSYPISSTNQVRDSGVLWVHTSIAKAAKTRA